tara:strand:+ start:205 stop:1215 length:1011 start_codon:yes stop_codon:yes gene_type:complete
MEKITYNNKAAYNALFHKSRFKIEDEIEESRFSLPDYVGIFLTKNDESLPVFAPVGSCEKVYSRKSSKNGDHSGARIVLTRDNFGHRATGLGGIGGTKCEAIDIVAGSLSASKQLRDGDTQSRANFAEDGARLYLTERGDVSSYFATATSETNGVFEPSLYKSGAGLKADHTLIIGRERVRILAGPSKYDDGERLVNGLEKITPIIEIGGTSSEKHQPAVLGDNLVKYLEKIADQFNEVEKRIQELRSDLTEYKVAMAFHQHVGAGVGAIVTFPDPIVAIPSALDSIPTFINDTSKTILQKYNTEVERMRAVGIPKIGITGTKENKILSSIVYIGE